MSSKLTLYTLWLLLFAYLGTFHGSAPWMAHVLKATVDASNATRGILSVGRDRFKTTTSVSANTTQTTAAKNHSNGWIPATKNRHRSMIVGGSRVQGNINHYGHTTGTSLCGGVILHRDMLLTAAHCDDGFRGAGFSLGSSIRHGGTFYATDRMYPHREYVKSDKSTWPYDIMLVKLNGDTGYTSTWAEDYVRPRTRSEAIVIGFGTTETGSTSSYLKYATSVIGSDADCRGVFPPYNSYLQICVRGWDGGVCHGDSGSGLYYNDLLIGILSAGLGDCGIGEIALYVDIQAHRNWIDENICRYSAYASAYRYCSSAPRPSPTPPRPSPTPPRPSPPSPTPPRPSPTPPRPLPPSPTPPRPSPTPPRPSPTPPRPSPPSPTPPRPSPTPPPPTISLDDGNTVRFTLDTGESRIYRLYPDHEGPVTCTLTGSTGDADLYVNWDSRPSDKEDYDEVSNDLESNEEITVENDGSNWRLYILVYAYEGFSTSVRLRCSSKEEEGTPTKRPTRPPNPSPPSLSPPAPSPTPIKRPTEQPPMADKTVSGRRKESSSVENPSRKGAIVGSVLGALALIAIGVALFFFKVTKRGAGREEAPLSKGFLRNDYHLSGAATGPDNGEEPVHMVVPVIDDEYGNDLSFKDLNNNGTVGTYQGTNTIGAVKSTSPLSQGGGKGPLVVSVINDDEECSSNFPTSLDFNKSGTMAKCPSQGTARVSRTAEFSSLSKQPCGGKKGLRVLPVINDDYSGHGGAADEDMLVLPVINDKCADTTSLHDVHTTNTKMRQGATIGTDVKGPATTESSSSRPLDHQHGGNNDVLVLPVIDDDKEDPSLQKHDKKAQGTSQRVDSVGPTAESSSCRLGQFFDDDPDLAKPQAPEGTSAPPAVKNAPPNQPRETIKRGPLVNPIVSDFELADTTGTTEASLSSSSASTSERDDEDNKEPTTEDSSPVQIESDQSQEPKDPTTADVNIDPIDASLTKEEKHTDAPLKVIPAISPQKAKADAEQVLAEMSFSSM